MSKDKGCPLQIPFGKTTLTVAKYSKVNQETFKLKTL